MLDPFVKQILEENKQQIEEQRVRIEDQSFIIGTLADMMEEIEMECDSKINRIIFKYRSLLQEHEEEDR